MARRAVRKTDIGTIILHWTLVILLVIAVATGLRIAINSPHDLVWLHQFDWLLPQSVVWTLHIPAGTMLFALAVSYTIYLNRAHLFRRIQPDLARLSGIVGRRRNARLGALNILLYWMFFIAIVIEIGTGILMYLGYAGSVADLHLTCTWIILAYAPAHLLVHAAIGGIPQLLRIFNPGPLAPPAEAFDPYDRLADVMRQNAQGVVRLAPPAPRPAETPPPAAVRPVRRPHPERAPRRGQVLRVHPLTVAIGGGMAALALLMSLDEATRDELVIDEILTAAERPVVDGDISDPIWRTARPVVVQTQQGANLDGGGGTTVEIRAVHDGVYAYFAFVWNDSTRSLKHLPLIKTAHGWRLLEDKFDRHDATAFFEDKFSVLLAPGYVLIPGDRTFHAGGKPLDDKPESLSGRGYHYTTDGSYVDVWQWRATEGGMAGWMDDSYFGPPTKPTKAEQNGTVPYDGGFAGDPGEFPYSLNVQETGGYDSPVTPKRLPKDLQRTHLAMGTIDLHADHGESDGARWWMEPANSVPYSPEADQGDPDRHGDPWDHRRRWLWRRQGRYTLRRALGGGPLGAGSLPPARRHQ